MWVALALLVACEPVPASRLGDVALPDGYVIDAARTVTLGVAGDPGGATLSVRTLGGEPLFDGPARFVAEHPLSLRIPGPDAAVVAEVDGDVVRVPVTGDVATVVLR